ncbi:MAG: hypothetical protein ACD_60C00025G0021 [uncultured bacterium]|nr:MAG: hypothetical protein ACD_60C00025G0021 [uncultured bacterium]
METAIIAIGTALPPYRRSQKETAELISASLYLTPAQKRLLKSVYKATGIEYRHSVLSDYCKNPGEFEFFPNNPDAPFPTTAARMDIYKKNALTLALTAIKNCLSNTAISKNEITHLITISCTGMYAPGIDIEIVQTLELPSTTKRTSIQFMGCYGAFNGIKVADDICKANENAKVLMVSVELCTLHFQKKYDLASIVSNAIFADGAAAILLEANSSQKKYLSLKAFHCDLIPQSSQEMAWHIADHGFDIVLSSYVPEMIQSGIAHFVTELSKKYPSPIDCYAIHPGGIKILEACEEALQISKEQNKHAYSVLKNYGNMSSATILFVLKAWWDDLQKDHHHKTVFSCAFGPGLTFESMLLKIHCPFSQ